MNKYLKGFLLIVLTLVLIVASAPAFGWFHDRFIETVSGSWIGTSDSWMFIIGLFYGYAFFVTFILVVFVNKKIKYYLSLFFIIALMFFMQFDKYAFLFLIVALIAVVLGELILFSYNKLKKKQVR